MSGRRLVARRGVHPHSSSGPSAWLLESVVSRLAPSRARVQHPFVPEQCAALPWLRGGWARARTGPPSNRVSTPARKTGVRACQGGYRQARTSSPRTAREARAGGVTFLAEAGSYARAQLATTSRRGASSQGNDQGPRRAPGRASPEATNPSNQPDRPESRRGAPPGPAPRLLRGPVTRSSASVSIS